MFLIKMSNVKVFRISLAACLEILAACISALQSLQSAHADNIICRFVMQVFSVHLSLLPTSAPADTCSSFPVMKAIVLQEVQENAVIHIYIELCIKSLALDYEPCKMNLDISCVLMVISHMAHKFKIW